MKVHFPFSLLQTIPVWYFIGKWHMRRFHKYWSFKAEKKGNFVYVALGDSTTVGIGATTPSQGYVENIEKHLIKTLHKKIQVVNLAKGGATTASLLKHQLPRLKTLKPNLITMCIGANDILLLKKKQTIQKNIEEIISSLPPKSLVSEVPCFCCFPQEKWLAEVNSHIKVLCKKHHMVFIPLHSTTHTYRKDFSFVSNDLLHPNDKAYRVWAQQFISKLSFDFLQKTRHLTT